MRICGWVMVLLSLLVMPLYGRAAELIHNPNSARAWTLETFEGAAATMREEAGALRFDIPKRPAREWHVQVYQTDKRVREDARLTLRFKAKASANWLLGVNSRTADSPWRIVLPEYQNVNLTPQWQTFSVPLVLHDVRGDIIRLPIFVLGGAAGTVWIKDVSLTDDESLRLNAVRSPAATPTTVPSASSEELLRDPMEPGSWKFETQADTRATIAAEAGILRVEVTQASRDPWHAQLYQVPAGLTAGTYTLSLSVRASEPRKIAFLIQHNAEPYELLVPFTQLQVGTEWKQYKIRFTLSKAFPDKTRAPIFQVGDAMGSVFIRSVSLERSPAPAK